MKLFGKQRGQSHNWQIGVHSSESFEAVLRGERMRSDRSGIRFSVVAFTLDPAQSTTCEAFIGHLKQRMRGTDQIGLMGESTIGVLLWDTLEPGAKIFIKTVSEHPSSECVRHAKILLYPDNRSPNESTEVASFTEDTQEAKEAGLSMAGIVTEGLEAYFVKPLPRWKRAIDIIGSTAGLIVLSPLLVTTGLLIKLTSRGPVLFKQQRDGLGGKQFTIYKFRTMREDAERLKDKLRQFSEQDGPAFKLTHDPRVTRIGTYLRKTCIDELPQLWNVLKGDMTLVGPRPLDSKEAMKITGWGRRRTEVTPGLTCIWQVYGKSKVSFGDWMRMDIRYINQKNAVMDFKLIANTLLAVVRQRASV